jgi:hypothetical protein
MKYATRMLAIVITLMPLLASAQLGSSDKLVTNVPFQFRAGEILIPAGECTVQRANMDSRTLVIGNWGAKVGLFANPSIAEATEPSSINAMVFHKYGDRYFLTSIKLKGSKAVYHLHESKAEAELRAQNVPASQEILLALLQ